MVLGLSLAAFTQLHVAISVIAILSGILFFAAVLRGRWPALWNNLFLVFTILTSVTGFLFPPKPIGPPFIFGVVSLVVLAAALYALYGQKLNGRWRTAYLLTALFAQYLNMIVLVVQSYQKIPALHALAPTGAEPPVLATQIVLLAVVLVTGWKLVRGRPPLAA